MENQNPPLPPNDPYTTPPTTPPVPVDQPTQPTFEPAQPVAQPIIQQPELPTNPGLMIEGGIDNIAPESAPSTHHVKKLLIVIIGSLVLIVLLVTGVILAKHSKKTNPTHPSTVGGSSETFTSTDGTVSALFPTKPSAVTVPARIPGTKINATKAEAWTYRPNRSTVYGLVEMYIPAGKTVSMSNITKGAAANGQLLASKNITLGGISASEVKVKFTRDNVVLYTTIAATIKNNAVYIVSYADSSDDAQAANNFMNSLSFL